MKKASRYMPDTNCSLHFARRPVALAVVRRLAGRPRPRCAAEGDDTAITIYSSAQPGAIPPEFYRPMPGPGMPNAMAVPGYAMVRQERAAAARERPLDDASSRTSRR